VRTSASERCRVVRKKVGSLIEGGAAEADTLSPPYQPTAAKAIGNQKAGAGLLRPGTGSKALSDQKLDPPEKRNACVTSFLAFEVTTA
jgi:hypothetical protein